jgi:lysophospholipase L1-like esterase
VNVPDQTPEAALRAPKFTQGKDGLAPAIVTDFLHLSPAGYQIWADTISPKLKELTK